MACVASQATAQAIWQPTPPPLVTAENETWYRAGNAIEWNGDFYYPAGAPRAFDPDAMVRAGSYRGIPLYTDATLEPYSIVFVPISGRRMQPYERWRAGMLADTSGSVTPSFPPQTAAALSLASEGSVAQAAMPPTFARAYDLAPAPAPVAAPQVQVPVGTTGSSVITAPPPAARTSRPSKSVSVVWIDYSGKRWTADGKAFELTADMQAVGTYRGFPVYARGSDRSTIYVPSGTTLVVPFTTKQ
jgi:hypothetical protein